MTGTLDDADAAGNRAGIDPHKRTLSVTVLDQRGGLLGTRTFKVSGDGHRAMDAWAHSFGPVATWGVEGASALGRHTAVFLAERGYDVRDVCPTRTAEQARRRRQGRHGRLDFRRTLRRSLSTGGVPADPRFRRPHPHKPEIVVLADVSGSVATFARFTLQLVHALAGEFSAVRTFVFIDGIDEVTRLLTGNDDLADALARVNTEADVVVADGHSDYGRALAAFWSRWGREIGPRTSVVILGDARNNYHAANAEVVGELARRARRVWWLNPEPRSYWDTGDSIVSEYGAHCDGVFECRNLRQLEGFVARIS